MVIVNLELVISLLCRVLIVIVSVVSRRGLLRERRCLRVSTDLLEVGRILCSRRADVVRVLELYDFEFL